MRRHITHLLPVVYEAADRSEAAMPELTEISFATGNANKLREVVAILEAGHPLPFRVKAANLDLPELQGEPEAIAMEKCRMAAQQVRAVWRRAAAGLRSMSGLCTRGPFRWHLRGTSLQCTQDSPCPVLW